MAWLCVIAGQYMLPLVLLYIMDHIHTNAMMFMNFLSFPGGVHLTSLPPQVFGMVEENTAQGNVLVNRHVRAGQAIHIPQGIQHFSHNPTCRGAQFLANFATADPGAVRGRVAVRRDTSMRCPHMVRKPELSRRPRCCRPSGHC